VRLPSRALAGAALLLSEGRIEASPGDGPYTSGPGADLLAPLEPLSVFAATAALLLFAGLARSKGRRSVELRRHGAVLGAALLAFAVSRALVAAGIWLAPAILTMPASHPWPIFPRPESPLLDALGARWDANFYLSIADSGYSFHVPRVPNWDSIGFFPLYPIAVRAVTPWVGDIVLAGVFVSNAALLAAVLFFGLLVEESDGPRIARLAVWFLLLFPASLFGSAAYAESLFLAGATLSLLSSKRGRWLAAGAAGLLAALARPLGFLMALVLALEWWRQRREDPSHGPGLAELGAAALPLAGPAAFAAYCAWAFADPFAYAHEQGRRFSKPIWHFLSDGVREVVAGPYSGTRFTLLAFGLLVLLGFVAAAILLVRWRRYPEAALVAGGLVVSGGGMLDSQPRYLWVLFPAFVVLAHGLSHRRAALVAATVTAIGLVVLTARFAFWRFVG
jgi:hypothetical protein